jgi:hypothetical protein
MLVIRREQMGAFEEQRRRNFKQRLAAHIEALLAGNGMHMAAAELRDTIEKGMKAAPDYGLIAERDVARYIEIACVYLGGLRSQEQRKEALAILYSYGLDPSVKLDRYQRWAELQQAESTRVQEVQ